jgi:hypothetical protein
LQTAKFTGHRELQLPLHALPAGCEYRNWRSKRPPSALRTRRTTTLPVAAGRGSPSSSARFWIASRSLVKSECSTGHPFGRSPCVAIVPALVPLGRAGRSPLAALHRVEDFFFVRIKRHDRPVLSASTTLWPCPCPMRTTISSHPMPRSAFSFSFVASSQVKYFTDQS